MTSVTRERNKKTVRKRRLAESEMQNETFYKYPISKLNRGICVKNRGHLEDSFGQSVKERDIITWPRSRKICFTLPGKDTHCVKIRIGFFARHTRQHLLAHAANAIDKLNRNKSINNFSTGKKLF